MEEIFLETVGRYLKRERESRSVSLKELSRATRISVSFLEALERDELAAFPQREYIPGFLKGCARHLGLDPSEALRLYALQCERERRRQNFQQLSLFGDASPPVEEGPEGKKILPPPERPEREKRSSRGVFLRLGVVLTAVGLSLYLHLHIRSTERPSVSAKTTAGREQDREPVKENTGKAQKKEKAAPAAERAAENGPGQRPASMKVVGDRGKKTYFLPGMKHYGRIEAGRRVEFSSEKEAVQAGYSKARE